MIIYTTNISISDSKIRIPPRTESFFLFSSLNLVISYLSSNLMISNRIPPIQQNSGIILKCADDAARGAAVAVVVDAAAGRRAVVGVDEVEGRGEGAGRRVSVAVGPRCHVRQVVGRRVAQQTLEIRLRRRRHEVACYVRYRLVAHCAPGESAWQPCRSKERNGCCLTRHWGCGLVLAV